MFIRRSLTILLCLSFILPFNFILAADDFQAAFAPNDKYLPLADFYLKQIHAYEAWDAVKESPSVIVAVIDSGVDIYHPDLAENIWRNQGEIAGDKIDNDKNGYVDDINGWDFILNVPDPRPKLGGEYTKLGMNHGTIVAGVIGAVGNNAFGLAGVSWKVKIMPLKVMNGEGNGNSLTVKNAVEYAIRQKADIINLSMVGSVYDPGLEQAIADAYASGIVVVAASGNENLDIENVSQDSYNLEINPQYPVCHDGPLGANYILGVGSVDENDRKSEFSNYGAKCMDLSAPGENFSGTLFYNPVVPEFQKYFGGYFTGTSLSAPLVSGAAALLSGLRPSLSNTEIYKILKESADNIDAKNPAYAGLLGSGRLNLKAAMDKAMAVKETGKIVMAAKAGEKPEIKIYGPSGILEKSFLAYAENFKGGVNLALADFDNDGQNEIITAAGTSGGPHVRVFKMDGRLVSQFFAYDKKFSGGVNLTAGDVDKDGVPEIITAPQTGSLSEIRIFTLSGELKNKFFAASGGLKLALSDINANGFKNIISLNSAGLVKIYSNNGKLVGQFKQYDASAQNQVISGENFSGDARQELGVFSYNGAKVKYWLYTASGDLLKIGSFALDNLGYAKASEQSAFRLIIK